jgi:hypothetical protein
MKKALLAIVLTFASSLCGTQARQPLPGGWDKRCELGFCLMPAANSYPVTFAILTWYGDSERPDDIRVITRHEFLSIAHGLIESEANPKKEDLFTKYEIKDCGYFLSGAGTTEFECSVVDDLWRLRYREYPYKVKVSPKGAGWGGLMDEMTWGQLDYLAKYGIRTRNDYFHGEKAFKLMKDMQSSDWINEYAHN